MTQPPNEVLAGLVERVTFHNADNGFCVLRVKARGHRELITVVGHAATHRRRRVDHRFGSGGSTIERTASSSRHNFCGCSTPTSADGIEKYLASGMIRGIGPVYAKKLVKAFGERVFDVIEAEPEQLRPGRRHRPEAVDTHHGGLGRAEGGPRDHGVPAQPRRRHGAGRSDLQDLRHRCGAGDEREPLSARPRHSRHRVQDRRCDRHAARHREDRDDPGACRDRLRARRGHERRALRAAHRGAGASCPGAARGRRRYRSDCPGAGTR
jgi:hypothetical protein